MRWPVLILLAGCGRPVDTEVPDPCLTETAPPEVQSTPKADGQRTGQDLLFEAIVRDDCDVTVSLHYRSGGEEWLDSPMYIVGGDANRGWFAQGIVRATEVFPPSVSYFFDATDVAGNRGCEPEECDAAPWTFTVTGE
jgi:hypothetical protein